MARSSLIAIRLAASNKLTPETSEVIVHHLDMLTTMCYLPNDVDNLPHTINQDVLHNLGIVDDIFEFFRKNFLPEDTVIATVRSCFSFLKGSARLALARPSG